MYKPLPEFLQISKSDIHGVGLKTTEDLPKDVCLGVTHIKNEAYPNGMIRTPLGGFFNHSDHPNCHYQRYGDNLLIFTSRKIVKGEELTVKYDYYF